MKRLIIILLIIGVYIGSLLFKDKLRLAHNAETPPTMGEIREKNGVPIYSSVVTKGDFNQSIKVSGFIDENGSLKTEITREVFLQTKLNNKVFLEIEKKKIQGKILEISSTADLYTGLYSIHIKFENLPIDVVGRVSVANIVYKTISNVIVIPRSTVSPREKDPFVYTVDKDRKLKKKVIKFSESNNDEYLVTFGLQAGDVIVTSDLRDLQENDFVFLAKRGEE